LVAEMKSSENRTKENTYREKKY